MYYPALSNMSPEDLSNAANSMFSQFDEDNFANLVGFSDEEFAGDEAIDSFLGAASGNRQYSILIDNNNTSALLKFDIFAGTVAYTQKTITIPSTYGTPASGVIPVTGTQVINVLEAPNGYLRDGFFKDKSGLGTSQADGLVASFTASKSIFELQQFLNENPTQLIKLKVVSNSENQIGIPFTVKRNDPFKVSEEQYLYPADVQDQNVNQNKIAVINTNVTLGPNRILSYAMAPSSTATITFYFGANSDRTRKLERRGNRATNVINMARRPKMSIGGRR